MTVPQTSFRAQIQSFADNSALASTHQELFSDNKAVADHALHSPHMECSDIDLRFTIQEEREKKPLRLRWVVPVLAERAGGKADRQKITEALAVFRERRRLQPDLVKLRRLKLHGIKRWKVPETHKKPFFALQKIKPVLKHQKKFLCKEFSTLCVPMARIFGGILCARPRA